MSKNLVIVESPAKCKTISKYLGKNFSVQATMGHIIDLPEKEIGIDFEHDFKPKYITSKGKKKVLQTLCAEAKKADVVYLAPDPDREGEAIAWHVAESIAKFNTNVKRVLFNEITKPAVLAAIANPLTLDMNKVNAQQARRILDRIVGYQVSPVLWKTVFRGLSAGRVQSVALRIICEREEAIKAFKQEEYWTIEALLEKTGSIFRARLISIDGAKAEIGNGEAAQILLKRLSKKPYIVSDVERKEKSRKPYPPFITSTLQQDAARKLGYSAAKTMMIAQQLYEGLELGEMGTMGLITYMRTDSTRIADEALKAARTYIGAQFGDKYLPPAPRAYSRSKNAQDAHEAIRPSQITADFHPDKIANFLARDQMRLYELIWKRFLACQMTNAIFDATRVDITVDNCIFRANGSIQKFDGFLTLYDETVEENVDGEEGLENLPHIDKGDKPNLKELQDKQHFTQPPPRYTEASLVKELEEKGIGRPSTYAQIIDTLKKRNYVTVDSKRFTPTDVGLMVKSILVQQFPDVFDVGFTAEMETSLDKVETSERNWIDVLHEFYTPFEIRLKAVMGEVKNIRAKNQEVTDRTCPECKENPLVIKWSRNGKFLACQGFPTCKYTEPLDRIAPVMTDEKCDKCGSPMVVLSINGNRFMGCSKYPECKSTKSVSTGVPCPLEGCGGMIVEKKTRRNKIFYGCNKFPACKFASWDLPLNKKCESCGYPIMVQKESKAKGTYLRCMQCRIEVAVNSPADGNP